MVRLRITCIIVWLAEL